MYAYTLQDALRSRIEELELFAAKLEVHRTEPFGHLVDRNIEEVQAQIEGLRGKLREVVARQRVEELANRVSVLRAKRNASNSHLVEFVVLGLVTRIEHLTSKLGVEA